MAQPRRDHLDMLRQVTQNMAATHSLTAVLHSIVTGLVEQTGALSSRVWLLTEAEDCEACRSSGVRTPVYPSSSPRVLHLSASAGIDAITSLDAVHHLLPVDAPIPPAYCVGSREPMRIAPSIFQDRNRWDPAFLDFLRSIEAAGAACYPLIFRGEVLGSIGMVCNRQLEDDEFELLGIFADQAAMAIKSAQMFRDLQRYREKLEIENAYLQEEIQVERGYEGIVGSSPALKAVLRKVRQVAPVETTVLLTGETGTGKELIARALHEGSPRKERPLIKVNCGAIPQGVVESELFGHEKGAFTGALTQRIGRFELANNGTLFMDEVGELPPDTQVKLLRVLQEQEFERVGSTRLQKVDVRLIAATNRDLEKEVAEARFRADLFYRLNVFPIRVPSLRERISDIPQLVTHFLAQFQRKLAKPLRKVSAESMRRMEEYSWPGNIRELQNVIERACVLADGPVVDIELGTVRPVRADGADDLVISLDDNERNHIKKALLATGGKVHGSDGAAAILGINPSTLRSRMRKLGIGKGA